MSRLDSVIRRLQAQRACLNAAADRVRGRDGPVLELGLGNGRTFDHLREILPGREVFVFERDPKPHPDCWPDAEHLIVGDVLEALPAFVARHGATTVMVHADIGTGEAERNKRLAASIAPLLVPILAPGAVVVSDQRLPIDTARDLPLPEGVAEGRYNMVEVG